MKTNWFAAAWLALTSCRPETPTAPSNEDGKAFVALETALKAVAAHRSDINPPPPNGTFVDRRAVTTHERREGNEILGIQTTTSESVERLEEMIMHDNTIGVIYPGALLWGTPFLTKSELHPVLPANRPPQAVTLTGATLTTGQSATFEFDGTYRTFIDTANEVLGTVQMTRALTKMQRSNITDLRSSLLALNMSARFWAGKFDASLEESYQRAASASLISIDRSDFSLTVQPKALAELVRADSLKEAGLLQPAAEDGELIYVRRVTYGRRLLVAVTSTASQADLEKALSFGINGIGVDVDAGIRQKLREISKSMVARMIVIGGEQDEHLNALQSQLIRDPGSLYDVLGAYLEATGARHRASAAVPLSFETAFAIDHTPVASFETAKFAREGKLYSCLPEGETVLTGSIELPPPAECLDGKDCEVDSNDNTLAQVWSSVRQDGKEVLLTVTYEVREGNGDRSTTDTHLRLSKDYRIPLNDERPFGAFIGNTDQNAQRWYNGHVYGLQPFHDVGALRDVRVEVDRDGGNDHEVARLLANYSIPIRLAREPAPPTEEKP